MGDVYTNPPQSRNEAILESIIEGTEYTAPPQSRIEDLLLDLKEVVEEGSVVANPDEVASETLSKLKVKETVYSVPSGGGGGGTNDYTQLENQPQINGTTLVGNKSASDLGLVAAETGKGLSENDYTDADAAIVAGVTDALAGKVDKVQGMGLSENDYTDADKAIVGGVTSALADKVDKNGTDSLMTAAEHTKLSGIAANAQVNTIESISVNGSAVTPDEHKNVALTVMTNAVNDLVNYYKKTETYTQAEVNSLIGAITTLNIEVVQELPTTNISTTTIYLVPKSSAQTQNTYDEYICLDATTTPATWEKIGDTEIDLTNYVQKSSTAGLLKNDGTVDTNTYAKASEAYLTGDTAETDLADNDYVPFYDTSATGKRKSLWSNIKAKLKVYFDTLYATIANLAAKVGWADNAVLGAKNLLPFPYYDKAGTYNGVAITIGSDGKVTAQNNPSDRVIFYLVGKTDNFHPKAGKWKIHKGFTNSNIAIGVNSVNNDTYVGRLATSMTSDDVEFTIDYNGYDRVEVFIDIASGTTISSPVVFEPMLYLASDTDSTYAPPAMTNKELTDSKVDWTDYAKTGVHQLLDLKLADIKAYNTEGTWSDNVYSLGGIDYTINADTNGNVLSIKTNGTATARKWLFLMHNQLANLGNTDFKFYETCVVGDYIYSDGVNTAEVNDKFINYNHLNNGGSIYLLIDNEVTVNNVVWKPLKRYKNDKDTSVTPYAMTNRELTDSVMPKASAISDAEGTSSLNKLTKIGNQVYLAYRATGVTLNAWQPIGTIPAGFRPAYNVWATAQNMTDGTIVRCSYNSDGSIAMPSAVNDKEIYLYVSYVTTA